MNPIHPLQERQLLLTRRHFFGRPATGIRTAPLRSLLNPALLSAATQTASPTAGALGGQLHHPAKAKRVIYLFMAGGPSQIDLFDYKPELEKVHQSELPDSVRMGQRITTMTSGQKSLPVVKSMFKFCLD